MQPSSTRLARSRQAVMRAAAAAIPPALASFTTKPS